MYMFPVALVPRSRTLRGLSRLGGQFIVPATQGCPSGSRQVNWLAPSGFITCEDAVAAPLPTTRQTEGGTGTRVSVPTTTQVQVSPMISPVFVQQFQPTGSPVGAGTAMTGAPVTPPADTGMQRYLEQRAQLEREESARQSELMARILAAREPQAAPPPQMQFIPGGPEAEPTPPAGAGGTAPAPGLFATLGRGGSWLPLLAAAGIIGIAVMGKGKKDGARRRKAKRK